MVIIDWLGFFEFILGLMGFKISKVKWCYLVNKVKLGLVVVI